MKRMCLGIVLTLAIAWGGGLNAARADHGHCGHGTHHGGATAYRSHYGGYYGRDIYGRPAAYPYALRGNPYLAPWPSTRISGYGGVIPGGFSQGFGSPYWGSSANSVFNMGPGITRGGPWVGGIHFGF